MKTVLVINASPNPSESYSRLLTERFVEQWTQHNPEDTFVFRELGNGNIPHVNQHWVQAAFTPEEARSVEDKQSIAFSDVLVSELQAADVIVLGSPMHNLSVPSTLKAYIDQVIRMGVTTSLAPGTPGSPYKGLLENKQAYLLLVQGGYGFGKGEIYEHLDFQQPYLTAILHMLGVTDVTTVKMSHSAMGEEMRLAACANAQAQVDALFH